MPFGVAPEPGSDTAATTMVGEMPETPLPPKSSLLQDDDSDLPEPGGVE